MTPTLSRRHWLMSAAALALTTSADAQTPPQPVVPRKTLRLPGGKAKDGPKGPFTPDWESLKTHYSYPEWFRDAKFGIFIHWGVYSVPAAFSEWYPRHMYGNPGVTRAHTERYGPPDTFGYKDIIPLFKAEKFDPSYWAGLFDEIGAKFVILTAEHHDGFAMYDSALTKWNARQMGPKRDLVGDLGRAVRARGLKYGLSNHRIEHWDFMYPRAGLKTDLFDPEYADFYGPPQKPPARSGVDAKNEVVHAAPAPQSQAFLEEWLARNQEIVDKYKPDIYFFDNGINNRILDPIKLRFAAYYYNSAAKWGKAVSLTTKSDAYLYGTITDYERQGRAPRTIQADPWMVDDPIGDKFGYVEGMGLKSAGVIIRQMVADVARGGCYALNISPKADGTIPANQQAVLREVGDWMKMNGEAIYGTRPWVRDTDGATFYTQKDNAVYAITLGMSAADLTLPDFKTSLGQVTSVTLAGSGTALAFRQNAQALIIDLPGAPESEHGFAVKIMVA